jgi:hypothetical protein
MAYIFMDESGDLGFDFRRKKTSKYFVVTFMFVNQKKPVEKIVKKLFREFAQIGKMHHPGTLHCNKEAVNTRLKVLKLLAFQNIRLLSIYLNKHKVYTKLQDEKQILYNYITNILLDRIYIKKLIPLDQPIYLIASRRETNRFFNENFKRYLSSKIYPNQKLRIDISIKSPTEEKCLQVVDFASWAIYRKYECSDEKYWRIIKEKIFEEGALFP